MTQKNILKILVIMIAVLSLFAVSCRKASTSPEPTPTPSDNPTVFTVEAGTSSPIKIIKDTDYKPYADGNIGAKVGGTSDYSVTITKVEQKDDKTVNVVLDASDFTVDKNTIKLSDAGIGKFKDKTLTEKQAKEYTLTLTYSTTANVEPKSREITTDIGIVQNHVVTKAEVSGIVKKAQKSIEQVSGGEGLIYLKPKEGSTSMNAITINMAGQDFQTTTPPDFKLDANNNDNNQFVADDALNIIGEALKNQTGYDTYFTDIKAIKKVIDTVSVDKATFYFQFILNKENAISDEIKNIVDETSGLSIEITLKGGGWE